MSCILYKMLDCTRCKTRRHVCHDTVQDVGLDVMYTVQDVGLNVMYTVQDVGLDVMYTVQDVRLDVMYAVQDVGLESRCRVYCVITRFYN